MNSKPEQWREADISQYLIQVLEQERRAGKLLYYVNLEGSRRDARQQVALKRAGARPGRPDIELFLPYGVMLFIELKRKKGGRLSDAQKNEINQLKFLGHEVHVVKAETGIDAAVQLTEILLEHRE
jgi:hypothetical protein